MIRIHIPTEPDVIQELYPYNLKQLFDSNYYYLESFDEHLNLIVSLLRKDDDSFVNVPLDDYYNFIGLAIEAPGKKIQDYSILDSEINLTDEMTYEELKSELGVEEVIEEDTDTKEEKNEDTKAEDVNEDVTEEEDKQEENKEDKQELRVIDNTKQELRIVDNAKQELSVVNNEKEETKIISFPKRPEEKRIFTDEERIDPKHSYLSVSNAKNLGYLNEEYEFPDKEAKPKINIFKQAVTKIKNKIDEANAAYYQPEEETVEEPIENNGPVVGFDYDEYRRREAAADAMVDAMANNTMDVDGNVIYLPDNSANTNTVDNGGHHIA